MALTEAQEQATREFEAASKNVQKALIANQGGKKAEIAYGEAYQGLVVAGLAPQLRKRYRP